MRQQLYIGGEFSKSDLDDIVHPVNCNQVERYFPVRIKNKQRVFFEAGADSLAHILNSLQSSNVTLWVPENFCYESLDRVMLKLPNVELQLKRYSDPYSISYQVKSVNAILVSYFNLYDPFLMEKISATVSSKSFTWIEDFTHCPLQINKATAHHAFCSMRKLIPVAISITYSTPLETISSSSESAFLKLKNLASEIKSCVLGNPEYCSEEVYLTLFKMAESQLENPTIQMAHQSQIEVLNHIDLDTVLTKRLSNYQHLAATIKATDPVEEIVAGEYMYFIIKTRFQKQLRKFFFDHGIFPAIHWTDSKSKISSEILSFHIDQRYKETDMIRIAQVLNSFKNKFKSA